jgi:hypothetical protein
MRKLAALLCLLLFATPASAQRVCQPVGQSVRCSDGNVYPPVQPPRTTTAPKPKDGTFEYYPDGTVCQIFGKNRTCR